MEAGIKSSFVKPDDNAAYFIAQNNVYVPDPNQSNHFIYTGNINAAYVNYSATFNKWSLEAGLRTEQTNSAGNQLTSRQQFSKHYLQLFPSFFIGYSPDKKSNIAFSYARRVDRPNYADLNPFVEYIDVYTRLSGNPHLNPVFSNNIELSYNFKNTLSISAWYAGLTVLLTPFIYSLIQVKYNLSCRKTSPAKHPWGLLPVIARR